MDHRSRPARGSLAGGRRVRRQLGRRRGRRSNAPTREQGSRRNGQDRRQAHRAVGWRRRLHRLRPYYCQMGVFICYSTQKPLYSYKPDDSTTMVPDLAEGPPEVSEDGKTVTVKIKPGVKYSPPYDKEVTSEDVKYAIERGFFTSVATASRRPTSATSRAPRSASKPARRSPASRRRTTTRSSSSSSAVGGVMAAGALALPGDRAGAGGVRGEVRRGADVDLRREPARRPART